MTRDVSNSDHSFQSIEPEQSYRQIFQLTAEVIDSTFVETLHTAIDPWKLVRLQSASWCNARDVMSREQAFSRFKAVNADVDALREHYALTLKPVAIAPPVGIRTISVEDQHFKIGEYDVWSGYCDSGIEVEFLEPPNSYVIYLPLNGDMEFEFADKKVQSSVGSIFVCDLDKVTKFRISPRRSHIGIAFGKDAVKKQLSKLISAPVSREIEFQQKVEVSSLVGTRLTAMCRLLWEQLSQNPQTALTAYSSELFVQTIMVSLLESVPHSHSSLLHERNSIPAPRHVVRAIDFMVAGVSRQLSVDEIAIAAGVSVRTLQLAFQEYKGTSPLGFLKNLRLNGVRQDLKRGGGASPSVAAVAQRWGFTHMGRFAALYREAFGEAPHASRFDE